MASAGRIFDDALLRAGRFRAVNARGLFAIAWIVVLSGAPGARAVELEEGDLVVGLVVTSTDVTVLRVDPDTGSTETIVTGVRAQGIAFAPDGRIVATSLNGTFWIDPVAESAHPLSSLPGSDVAVTPTGDVYLWGGNRVRRIDPATGGASLVFDGTSSGEFPLGFSVGGMASDTAGNLWLAGETLVSGPTGLPSRRLVRIDLPSEQVTIVGDDLDLPVPPNGLALDETLGRAYLGSSDALFAIDLSSGAIVTPPVFPPVGALMNAVVDVAVVPGGTRFAAGTRDPFRTGALVASSTPGALLPAGVTGTSAGAFESIARFEGVSPPPPAAVPAVGTPLRVALALALVATGAWISRARLQAEIPSGSGISS